MKYDIFRPKVGKKLARVPSLLVSNMSNRMNGGLDKYQSCSIPGRMMGVVCLNGLSDFLLAEKCQVLLFRFLFFFFPGAGFPV
jgi:hypothetical protein